MNSLDDKLKAILEDWGMAENYSESAVAQIKQAFTDAGYIDKHLLDYPGELKKQLNYYSGQEWYDRFKAEYHNKADWISAEPDMGDDAEHDVLLAARLAANIKETN